MSGDPHFIAQFDAYLFGGVVLLYDCELVILLEGSSLSLRMLKFCQDSSYQNLSEFIVAIKIIMIARTKDETLRVMFKGDSNVALTWMKSWV